MLKPDLLEHAMTGTYSFCSARDCPVVYFEEQGGRKFTLDDLRVPVGVKASADPIPLCYCFGFDESHIREEIFRMGPRPFQVGSQRSSERAYARAKRATRLESAAWAK